MIWHDPHWLLLLWVLPVAAGLLVLARRWRRAAMDRFAEPTAQARLFPPESTWRSGLKVLCWFLGMTLLIVGLARPRWGRTIEQVHSRGIDVLVLLDVSRSMLANDVLPNRLEHAKADIRDLVAQLRGDRIGLVIFAGTPAVAVPLTTDHAFFLTALEQIDTESAPRGGSLIGDAIRKGIDAFGPRGNRDQVMVLITDGEDHDSFPREAAKTAAEMSIKIITVGLGDPIEGQRIPIRDNRGNLTYLEEDGRPVRSKMDETLLLQIARETSGAYVPAQTRAYDLGAIYDEQLAQLIQGEIASDRRQRYADRFQIFVLTGFVLMLIDSLVDTRSWKQALPGNLATARALTPAGTYREGQP